MAGGGVERGPPECDASACWPGSGGLWPRLDATGPLMNGTHCAFEQTTSGETDPFEALKITRGSGEG